MSRLDGDETSVVDHDPPRTISLDNLNTLWDAAYDDIGKQNKHVLDRYEAMVAYDLYHSHKKPEHQASSAKSVGNIAHSFTFQVRRSQMRSLLDIWANGGSEDRSHQSISQDADSFSTLFYRDIVMRSIERMSPAAVVPWVAACYASKVDYVITTPLKRELTIFQALQQSRPKTHNAYTNLIHVISRMEWYDRLQKLFVGDEEHDPAYIEFLTRLKDLYTTILLYFMNVAIFHSPHFGYGLPSPLPNDQQAFDLVSKTETALAGFNEQQVDRPLRRLFEAAPVQIELHNGLLDGLRVADPRPHLASSDMMHRQTTRELYHLLQMRKEYHDFMDWEKPNCQLLWIRGDHGQGKTKLLHGTVQALHERPDSPGVAFFFFSHASHESDNAAAALRNLIWFMIIRCPSLAQHLKDKLKMTARKQFNHPPDFGPLSGLFFNIIQDPEFQKMYLIIGSMDECDYHRTEFVDLIMESASVCSRIKWLVSGVSKSEGSLWHHLDLASDMHGLDAAVHNYIKYTVSTLARDNSYDKEFETSVTNKLCQLSINNYLWVDIVCEVLKSKDLWLVEPFLDQVGLKRDLQSLYSLLHEIVDSQQKGNHSCIDVLLTMGAVHQSLGLDELKKLMKWSPGVDMKTVLQQCSGFLRLRGDKISFRHESARDHVRQCLLDSIKRSKVHVTLTVRCLKYLGDSLENHYTVLPCGSDDERILARTVAGSYASLYWMKHLVQITDVAQNTEVQKAVLSFLKRHFLQWVDAVTQGDEIQLVVSRLRNADIHFQRMEKKNIGELADAMHDAHMFLQLHISINHPNYLQASNTTIFCLDTSLVKRSWAPTVHPWLCKLPQMDRSWSPNFTTFRGHKDRVSSISITSDSRVLASGSNDGTVRIWDTETGTTQHVFGVREGTYSYVTLVALTPRIVAAGSDNCPVILWNILTGREVGELPAYTKGADALCLSPDSGKVAVGVCSKVYVWSIDELPGGSQFRKLIEYEIKALSLVFSQDDELLITSEDVIQLWNIKPFQLLQKFTSEAKKFICTALSPRKVSGRRFLASGSKEGIISIWETDADIEQPESAVTPDTETLNKEEKERGSKNEDAQMATPVHEYKTGSDINSLAFSPSGSQLASSSHDVINIWESATWRHLNTLQSAGLGSKAIAFDQLRGGYLISSAIDKGVHFWFVNDKNGEGPPSEDLVKQGWISGLTLHPNGKILAAVRPDNTVFLWNLESATLECPKMDFDHRDDLRVLVFSPNEGDKLLSTSDDGTAQVCDVATGKRLYVFKGHRDWVRSAAWSPDGGHVATGCDDGSIRFWEIGNQADPNPVAELERSHGKEYVTALTFCPSGQYLISGGTDGNLIVWEKDPKGDWERKHERLAGHTGGIACVLVTPDSKCVLSASADQTLRGWDIEGGTEISKTKIDWVDFNMWWDLSRVSQGETPNHVMTPQGAWLHHLPAAVLENQNVSQWRVRYDADMNQWCITFDNKDIAVIPEEYIPSSSLVVGNKVVVGSVAERLYVLECKSPMTTF
ncbi:putative wd-repeat protein [Rosellinia necatrix]|uniref:Putative wd-repeat protein n=1 Tax=Rosellinia necatrix TaxID=77044 RepID=A0A1W2TWI2_ROSNE|nr:putative wd-repeat protein [Rosellinia necatrix]